MLIAPLFGCVSQAKHAIDPTLREQASGRELVITVTQGEIGADIDPATGGAGLGLIGALIDVSVTQSRAGTAEETVKPIRNELVGYDFDGIAMKSVEATMKSVPWLGINKVQFFKDMSPDRLNESLDSSATEQVVFSDVRYSLRPDFSGLGISWTVSILSKTPPAGQEKSKRLANENFVFNRAFLCVAPASSKEPDKPSYANLWASNQGEPVRNAVGRCMSAMTMLTRQSLEMTPEAIESQKKSLSGQKQETISGYTGKVFARDTEGVLLIDATDRWIFVLGDVNA
jgi:hypothetical protein